MSEKYKYFDNEGPYFIPTTIVSWIDLFTKQRYVDILIEAIIHAIKNKGLVVHAWCIMPSHLHMIVSSKNQIPIGKNIC